MIPKRTLILAAALVLVAASACQAASDVSVAAPAGLHVALEQPADLERVKPGDSLVFRFDQPMDPGSAEKPVTFKPVVIGDFSWSEGDAVLTFQPRRGFTGGKRYVATLKPGLLSAAGEDFPQPPTWEFETLPVPRVERSPVERLDSGVAVRFRLSFSQPMEAASVADALRVEPEVALDLHWVGHTLVVKTAGRLEPGAEYEFSLSPEAVSVEGAPIPEKRRWFYTVPEILQGAQYPDPGDPLGDLVLSFNYPMDWEQLKRVFRLEPSIEGTLEVDQSRSALVFTPASPLPLETVFEVGFREPLRSESGEELGEVEPLHFATPPAIVSVRPTAFDHVDPEVALEVAFSRPMDHARTEAAFQIAPRVEGVFSWRGNTLVFTPQEGALGDETAYEVAIGTEAVDQFGAPALDRDYHWSFQTLRRPPVASFRGYVPNVYLTHPHSGFSLSFEIYKRSATEITFDLFRLTPEQFGDLYVHHFQDGYREPSSAMSAEGAELVKSWAWGGSYETTVPGRLERGLYLLNLVTTRVEDQMLLVVSDKLIAAKAAGGQVVAWVTDRDGKPLPDAEVSVFISNGQLAERGVTDDEGVYRTWVFGSDQPALVVARLGDDVTAAGLAHAWETTSPTGCGWWGWGPGRGEAPPGGLSIAAHMHTDRPIYRPGQTVHFKAIIRLDQDALITLPKEGTPVAVRVLDARGNVLETQQLTTNGFGTVNGDFGLAEGAMLGDYAVEVVVDDATFRQAFKVEDYRKPDYSVTVQTDAEQYLEGDEIRVSVESSYFMGQPVADAQVSVRRFLMNRRWYGYGEPTEVIDLEAKTKGSTDENGRLTFTVESSGYGGYPIDWVGSLTMAEMGIEVSVNDGSRQTVSGFVVVPVYNASEGIALSTDGYYHTLGEDVPVRVEVKSIDGQPVEGRSLEWRVQRYNDDDYGVSTVQSASFTTGPDGRARATYRVTKAGWYEIEVYGRDAGEREITARRYFYTPGAGGRRYARGVLGVSADRDRYAPGDVARLMIESDYSGPALLTFERASVRRQRLVTLTAPVTTVEVPIRTDDVPNVYVAVTAWMPFANLEYSGGPLGSFEKYADTESVELQVPATGKALEVEITSDQPVYTPREKATFRIRVRDSGGRPVSAELSLALVDEAIYALSEELSPTLLETFYGPREHLVRAYDTLSLMSYLFVSGGCGGGGGGGGPLFGRPRSDFPDTAVWIPRVVTDASGEATIEVELPDSLTTWRLTARAVTTDTKVGEATAQVVTQQPLVVRPLLPRTLTEGDTATLSASVHNVTGRSMTVEVSLESEALGIGGSGVKRLILRSNEVRLVSWPATAKRAGSATVTLRAQGKETGDAVQVTLPVRSLAVRDVHVEAGDTGRQRRITFELPEDASAGTSVRLELSRSVAGSLLEGLEYLTGFPYGCVEQTMSAALPNAVIGRAFHQLGVSRPEFDAELQTKIDAGLQKLYGLQHDDGGWGWWYDDRTDDYQTAWVVYGLAMTEQAGYEVDPGVIQRGAKWLAEHLSEMDARTRAFALYSLALAGYPEVDHALNLFERPGALDPFSEAALALALHLQGSTAEAAELLEALAGGASVENGRVYWSVPNEDGQYYHKTMASSTRSTAMALSAFVQIENEHDDLIGGIVRWLMGQRKAQGWGTTNETSFAIVGLTDHLLASREADETTRYWVELNGLEVASGELTPEAHTTTLEIPSRDLRPGQNVLWLRQEGGERLYYSLVRETFLPRKEVEAAGPVGVRRAYLDAETERPIGGFEEGQLVLVRLTVSLPEDRAYMIVEDHLPGGLEALNERLNNVSHIAAADAYGEYLEPEFFWEDYGYNYKEVRADRVSFFITELGRGERTFSYYARATHSGTFVAPPAEAYAMYDLASWGRSSSDVLGISPQGVEAVRSSGETPAAAPQLDPRFADRTKP